MGRASRPREGRGIEGDRRAIGRAACIAAPILLTACRGPQSALDPAGPAASAIATSWWLMAVGALIAWAVVLLLAGLAMRRRRGLGTRGGQRMILVGGVLVPATLLAALLVYGTLASDRVTGASDDVEHVVHVTARQWQWEFEYLDAAGAPVAASVDHLALPLDAMVEFHIDSVDVIHSFWIPRLGGKIDAIPGRTNVWRLRAAQAGPMRGQCAEFCGLEHAHMEFDVTVLEADAFAQWLQANSIAAAGAAAGGAAR